MHPFCLPFGFCHDATSSSIAADFTNSLHSNNNNNNNISSNNDYIKDKIRSKASSPSDELFRHLNNATSTSSAVTCQSLLNDHDLIIGSTSSLQDITNDEHSFYSLELDADIETDSTNCENDDRDLIDSDIVGCFATSASDDDLKITSNVDDWFCSSQFSLFSPINSNNNTSIDNCLNNRRKSLIKSALLNGGTIHSGATSQNHVFQHIVDPIDIKSSPTLAQLNLNSNDDPNDGFWNSPTAQNVASSAAGAVSATTTTLSSSTSTNSDLLSNNSTSINNHHLHHHHQHHHHHHQQQHQTSSPSLNGVDNSINLNCDHLQHNHAPNNHHLIPSPTSTSPYSSAHLNNISSCHHVHHRHHHHQHQGRFSSSTAQSTCLAVTPFRRPVDLGHQYPPCCQNLLTTTNHLDSNLLNRHTSSNSNTINNHDCSNGNANDGSNNGSNLKPSATLNQLNQQLNRQSSPLNPPVMLPTSPSFRQLATIDKSENQQNKSNQQLQQQQPRSASPALVTSSSSPLSSSLNQAGGENRYIDNKLKENIEYLTALLCNGNKLDNNNGNNINQQATISSTMARSYTTLAQSLSTGPKLLEKQQATQMAQFNVNAQQKMLSQPNLQIITSNLTNEAAPCTIGVNHQNFHQTQTPNQQQQHQAQQEQHQQHQHQQQAVNPLKRPYPTDLWFKSNVESSVSAADSTESQVSSLTNSIPDLSNNGRTICPTGKLASCAHNQQLSNSPQATIIDQRQKQSELKVLSSLLNANKCPSNQNVDCNATSNWQQNNANCVQQQQQQLQQTASIAKQAAQVPIVINTSGPNLIDQQQQSKKANPDPSSIPVNGKPITLKPVAQNNLIIQQQQRPRHSTTLFAQPASPSASSTASSGNNTDVCSASSTSTSAVASSSNKRQRQIQSSNSGKNTTTTITSNRSNRPNSMSTDCSLSSHDESFSSQVDIDDGGSTRAGDSDDEDDDVDSDDESFYGDYTNSDLIGASISDNAENKWTLNMGRTRRNGQKRYFWQYNVQSKGPKGTRICSTDDSEDPFVLPEASDPVFSNDCQVEGVKHSGKARRGDGNDLTPNPRKLLMIGLELKKLGKIINDLAPVTNLPMNARNKTRKEKNKLASRACRLKKKAQHEANKIKLYGLQREHQQVVKAIYDIRKLLNENVLERDLKDLKQNERQDTFNGESEQQESKSKSETETTTITTLPTTSSNSNATTNSSTTNSPLPTTATATTNNNSTTNNSSRNNNNNSNGNICYGNVSESVKTIAEQCSLKVAGQTSDYVNSVLEKVVSGCIDGGLQT